MAYLRLGLNLGVFMERMRSTSNRSDVMNCPRCELQVVFVLPDRPKPPGVCHCFSDGIAAVGWTRKHTAQFCERMLEDIKGVLRGESKRRRARKRSKP